MDDHVLYGQRLHAVERRGETRGLYWQQQLAQSTHTRRRTSDSGCLQPPSRTWSRRGGCRRLRLTAIGNCPVRARAGLPLAIARRRGIRFQDKEQREPCALACALRTPQTRSLAERTAQPSVPDTSARKNGSTFDTARFGTPTMGRSGAGPAPCSGTVERGPLFLQPELQRERPVFLVLKPSSGSSPFRYDTPNPISPPLPSIGK